MREMRSFVLLVLTLALSAGLASAQSLAEVAKKEKKRREANDAEAKRVITDRELQSGYPTLPTSRTTSPTTEEGGAEETGETAEEEEAEVEDPTETREYWQDRVNVAKEKIARLESEIANNDWGQGQRVGVDPRGQNNLARRQQKEQELQAARAELEAIRVEARRAGVPPGWVR